jgi:hypothetical protein
MTMMNEKFAGSYAVTDSLAIVVLERLLGGKDPCNRAAATLALASYDADGSLDPGLRSVVLSDVFIERLAQELAGLDGRKLDCPPGFVQALNDFIARNPAFQANLSINTYKTRTP